MYRNDSDDIVTAILDADSGEILLPNNFSHLVPQFCLPDADNLLQRLLMNGSQLDLNAPRSKPSYITTSNQKDEAKRIQGEISLHLTALISLGKAFRQQQRTIVMKAEAGVLEDDESEGDLDERDEDEEGDSKAKLLKTYYEQIAQGSSPSLPKEVLQSNDASNKIQEGKQENFIRLGKIQFSNSDHDGFMKRFVNTQVSISNFVLKIQQMFIHYSYSYRCSRKQPMKTNGRSSKPRSLSPCTYL